MVTLSPKFYVNVFTKNYLTEVNNKTINTKEKKFFSPIN